MCGESVTHKTVFCGLSLVCMMMQLQLLICTAAGCTSGDLRLTNTSFGLLQICKSNQWRAVCSRDWGHLDAAVACRQLGFDGIWAEIFVLLTTFHCAILLCLQEATLRVQAPTAETE